jgi:3-(methylthio)propanoyl-CoA dehydrogenase
LGVAAQSLGLTQAAFVEAFRYAQEREQFGRRIVEFPPVAEMLVEIRCTLEAMRSLVYRTSEAVDIHEGLNARLAGMTRTDPGYPALRERRDSFGQRAELLTPIAKFYTSEAAIRLTNLALQVHGGNGYMRDYPVERICRDARITSIYEGTSQLQVDRAVSKIIKGSMTELLDDKAAGLVSAPQSEELARQLREAHDLFCGALDFVRSRRTVEPASEKEETIAFRDLTARRLVEMSAEVYMGYLLMEEAQLWERKLPVAAHFIGQTVAKARMHSYAIQQVGLSQLSLLQEILMGAKGAE